MYLLRQSTAGQEVPLGYFLDSSDGDTEETGLTIANTNIKLHKTGATTLANKNSGGGTHISNGVYYATFDATDTDTLGPMTVFVHVSGALAVRLECMVVTSARYDVLTGTTANTPSDVVQISGDSTAADNAEAFFDGTGYAGTNNVIPSVTTVTGNVNGSVASVTGTVGGIAGTITTLDALDTAQDSQHNTTQTYLSTNLGSLGANATEAGGTGDQFTDLALSAAGVSAVQSGLATPTNITAGTITTVTNLTNAPTNGDLTATMKASVTSAVPTATAIGTQVWATAGRALSDPAGFKKNTQADITFVMRDSTNGRTPIAGETVAAQRSLDGAAFASCANSVTEIGNGAYIITLAATDLNADIVILRFTSSDSDDLLITIKTET